MRRFWAWLVRPTALVLSVVTALVSAGAVVNRSTERQVWRELQRPAYDWLSARLAGPLP